MAYKVVFSPQAEEQLAEFYSFIAVAASPTTAARYTEAIVTHCESLESFPHRGTRRDDIRQGLRITHYGKRAAVAFTVGEETVSIVGVFYGGQNFERALEPAMGGYTLHEPIRPLANGLASKGSQAQARRCLKQRHLQGWPMLSATLTIPNIVPVFFV